MSERDKNEETHGRVITKTCHDHMTPTQKARIDYRTLLQKRKGLLIGDKVTTTDEYKENSKGSFRPEHEHDYDGVIAGFNDPWDWEGPKTTSCVLVDTPCGCRKLINTSWLKKRD